MRKSQSEVLFQWFLRMNGLIRRSSKAKEEKKFKAWPPSLGLLLVRDRQVSKTCGKTSQESNQVLEGNQSR